MCRKDKLTKAAFFECVFLCVRVSSGKGKGNLEPDICSEHFFIRSSRHSIPWGSLFECSEEWKSAVKFARMTLPLAESERCVNEDFLAKKSARRVAEFAGDMLRDRHEWTCEY